MNCVIKPFTINICCYVKLHREGVHNLSALVLRKKETENREICTQS